MAGSSAGWRPCLVAIAVTPAYRRWYASMRRPGADERDAVAAAVAEGGSRLR